MNRLLGLAVGVIAWLGLMTDVSIEFRFLRRSVQRSVRAGDGLCNQPVPRMSRDGCHLLRRGISSSVYCLLVVWLIQPSLATAQGTSWSRFDSMRVGHHWHQRAVRALAHPLIPASTYI
jgi:hypothetical protein